MGGALPHEMQIFCLPPPPLSSHICSGGWGDLQQREKQGDERKLQNWLPLMGEWKSLSLAQVHTESKPFFQFYLSNWFPCKEILFWNRICVLRSTKALYVPFGDWRPPGWHMSSLELSKDNSVRGKKLMNFVFLIAENWIICVWEISSFLSKSSVYFCQSFTNMPSVWLLPKCTCLIVTAFCWIF